VPCDRRRADHPSSERDNQMRRLKTGVIGLGNWGLKHAAVYHEHPAVELAALCDMDAARLEACGKQFGVRARFRDYRQMLRLEELDAVSVVTPDFSHTEIVLAAIEAGKAVLVEKPLATTLQECDLIGQALRQRPVPFMVDFHNRWSPGIVLMRQQVGAGSIGQVRMVYCRLSDTLFVPTRMLPWAGRSSVNWFLGSHCVDTLRWLLADEVASLYTVSRSGVLSALGVETPDYFLSVLEFRRGACALLENCWILPESSPSLVDFKLELVGSEGAFHFDGSPHRLVRLDRNGAECPDTFISPEVHGRPVGFAVESIRHFIECLLAGRQPMVGFDDAREVTRVILAMEESARAGEPVEL